MLRKETLGAFLAENADRGGFWSGDWLCMKIQKDLFKILTEFVSSRELEDVTDLYLVLHVFWQVFPGGAPGEVCGQFRGRRREVSPSVSQPPRAGRVVPASGRWKTTCGGVTSLHLHHPPAMSHCQHDGKRESHSQHGGKRVTQ